MSGSVDIRGGGARCLPRAAVAGPYGFFPHCRTPAPGDFETLGWRIVSVLYGAPMDRRAVSFYGDR